AGGDITIDLGGQVAADGGNGGGATSSPQRGSGGGGGAGGVIGLLSGGVLSLKGSASAVKGTGGGGGADPIGGDGGDGWIGFVDRSGIGTVTGTVVPATSASGTAHFSLQSAVVQSLSYDLGQPLTGREKVTIGSATPTGTSLTFAFAGSFDNFNSDT